jgi:hypothetical protein
VEHVQVKPPAVLAHVALASQPCVLATHSSTSSHVTPLPV